MKGFLTFWAEDEDRWDFMERMGDLWFEADQEANVMRLGRRGG